MPHNKPDFKYLRAKATVADLQQVCRAHNIAYSPTDNRHKLLDKILQHFGAK